MGLGRVCGQRLGEMQLWPFGCHCSAFNVPLEFPLVLYHGAHRDSALKASVDAAQTILLKSGRCNRILKDDRYVLLNRADRRPSDTRTRTSHWQPHYQWRLRSIMCVKAVVRSTIKQFSVVKFTQVRSLGCKQPIIPFSVLGFYVIRHKTGQLHLHTQSARTQPIVVWAKGRSPWVSLLFPKH
jgi:hypothetical protein